MKRNNELRGVVLPESLQQQLDSLLALFRSGGSPAQRDQALASLQSTFLRAVQRGHITLAQERLFAERLRAICGPAGADTAAVLPAWRQPTTDEISLN